MVLLIFLYLINTFLMLVIALIEYKKPMWLVPWLIAGILLPILGPLLYMLLSWPKHKRNEPTVSEAPVDIYDWGKNFSSPIAQTIMQTLTKLGSMPFIAHAKILSLGEPTFDVLIRTLQSARRTIDIDFYIYRNDEIGQWVTETLIEKAREGVKIRFLRDGVGSMRFPKKELSRLAASGVQCRIFHPIRFPWLTPALNQRDHGKMVIVDKEKAFIGGVNVGNEYTGNDPRIGPWRDTELYLFSTELQSLTKAFEKNWEQATREFLQSNKPTATHISSKNRRTSIRYPLPLLNYETAAELEPQLIKRETNQSNDRTAVAKLDDLIETCVQTVYGDPDTNLNMMQQLFFLCVTQAQYSLDITTPYFTPDRDLIIAITSAAIRGVHVRLMMPLHVDHQFINLANRTFYPELIDAGVLLYLYNKGILHAKTMVIDEEISIVGATNFDFRSFRLNREVCEVMYDRNVAAKLKTQFEQDLLDTTRITSDDILSDSIGKGILERSARLFASFL